MRLKPLAQHPLASVLIANYNYEKYIGEAIQSVLNQSYSNFEVIVCDDGSTDRSREVVEAFGQQDKRVVLVAKENGGQASAFNAAYEHANGDLIALLDADDVWFPNRLELVVQAFQKSPEAGVVTHPLKVVQVDGRTLRDEYPRKLSQGWLGPLLIRGEQARVPPTSGLTLRREICEIIFPLPETFRTCADRPLQERALLLAPIAATQQVVGLYRQHGSNVWGLQRFTTLGRINSALEMNERILKARVEFLQSVCGITWDPAGERGRGERELWLGKALLEHKRLSYEQIGFQTTGIRQHIWWTLFVLPRWLSERLFRFWWGEGFLKRVLRRFGYHGTSW